MPDHEVVLIGKVRVEIPRANVLMDVREMAHLVVPPMADGSFNPGHPARITRIPSPFVALALPLYSLVGHDALPRGSIGELLLKKIPRIVRIGTHFPSRNLYQESHCVDGGEALSCRHRRCPVYHSSRTSTSTSGPCCRSDP